MTKITLSKIEHRGEIRIKVSFQKQAELIEKIKSIDGRKWSATKQCWHLPYSTAAFNALKDKFGDRHIEIIVAPNDKGQKAIEPNTELEQSPSATQGKQEKNPEFIPYQINGETRRKVTGNKIIVEKNDPHWLETYVPFDKSGWVLAVKEIVGRKWNVDKTCWMLPNVKTSFYHLKNQIGLENVEFDFVIEKDIPDVFELPSEAYPKTIRKSNYEKLNDLQKKAVDSTVEQLMLKQFSTSTINSYKSKLIHLFLFHHEVDPSQLQPKDVEKYLLHLIRFKKIAETTQNQIINAYKAYVEKALKRNKEWVNIPRPKKPIQLPNVLSEREVVKLIQATKNIKHKLILLLIYSAGLRLGEVVKIRVRDISFDRRVIFIKGAKGKKDRYVTLAETVIPYITKYKKEKNPVYWLLEGQNGGQYSKRSVQQVFTKALEQSKINAYATVHTLRHSYATHCIENGFSLPLVQEALGHESLKTTERYLHISSRALGQLKSPLDILKNKTGD